MPYNLQLTRGLANAGWKVKIRDRERLEPPHVTILFRSKNWRINLRTRTFMDDGDWSEIDEDVRTAIEENWELLCAEWDRMYPNNPIQSEEEDDA
jgi:hypothetical protein